MSVKGSFFATYSIEYGPKTHMKKKLLDASSFFCRSLNRFWLRMHKLNPVFKGVIT